MSEQVALVLAAMMARLGVREIKLTAEELAVAGGTRVIAMEDAVTRDWRIRTEPKPKVLAGR